MRQLGSLARAVASLPPTFRPLWTTQRQISTSLICRSGSVPEEENLPEHAQVRLVHLPRMVLNLVPSYVRFSLLHVSPHDYLIRAFQSFWRIRGVEARRSCTSLEPPPLPPPGQLQTKFPHPLQNSWVRLLKFIGILVPHLIVSVPVLVFRHVKND